MSKAFSARITALLSAQPDDLVTGNHQPRGVLFMTSGPSRLMQIRYISRRWYVNFIALLAVSLASLASGTGTTHIPTLTQAAPPEGGGSASAPQHSLVIKQQVPDSYIPVVQASDSRAVQSPPSGPTRQSQQQPSALVTQPGNQEALGASPTATPAASPASVSTTPSDLGWSLPDPTQWVQDVLSTVLVAFFSGILTAISHILDWAQGIGGSAFNFVTRTPPEGTYASASVVALWQWVVGVADAALAVFVLWGGYAAMSRDALGTRAHSAMQLLPRLGLAALAANLSLVFSSSFIDLGNALCTGVGQVGLPGYSTATSLQQNLAALVLAVVYAVVGFLLIAQMLLRLALLDVLIVTAPLGFLCWALPQTQAWARLWTSTFMATVLVQFLQILALRLGALLVNELTPGRLDSATLTLLTGIATLYLTFKLPHMLQSWALRSVGAASMGGVVEQGIATAQAIGSVAAAALA